MPASSFPSLLPLGESHLPLVTIIGNGATSGALSAVVGTTGILTVGTAMPAAFTGGYPSYIYVPVGGFGGGSPASAGVYYAVWTSTTNAQIYNNTYSSGAAAIPSSPTSLGTITGATWNIGALSAGAGLSYLLNIPGGTLGINDTLRATFLLSGLSATNSWGFYSSLSGSSLRSVSVAANSAQSSIEARINLRNRGQLSQQICEYGFSLGEAVASSPGGPTYTAVNTALSQVLWVYPVVPAGAAYIILESILVEQIKGV